MGKSLIENAVLGAFENRNHRLTEKAIIKRIKLTGSQSGIIGQVIQSLEEQKIIKSDKRSYILTAAGKKRMAAHFRKIRISNPSKYFKSKKRRIICH